MKKTVVILALVLSLAVNVTQFLVFKQSNNQEVIETKEQTVNQEKEILKGTIKEREKRINELQSQLDQANKTPEPRDQKNVFEEVYSDMAIRFSKVALSGQSAAVNYEKELKDIATEELYNRMTKSSGTQTKNPSITLKFSDESAYIDTKSMTDETATVFVRMGYSYNAENDSKNQQQPVSIAYLRLTLIKDTQGQVRVSNFEMG